MIENETREVVLVLVQIGFRVACTIIFSKVGQVTPDITCITKRRAEVTRQLVNIGIKGCLYSARCPWSALLHTIDARVTVGVACLLLVVVGEEEGTSTQGTTKHGCKQDL